MSEASVFGVEFGVEFVQLSLPPMVIGGLAAVACALPGNFLLLRRQALLGDAISHVALPGIVVAFLIVGGVSSWPMLIGAAVAAAIAALMIEAIRGLGRVEPGAAMGVVFTAMFAFGVLLLEQSGASGGHLDVEHALHGNLESLIWFEAEGWGSLIDLAALSEAPPQALRLAIVVALIALAMRLFWKELVVSTFDPGFARATGAPTRAIGFGLTMAAALAAVASFEAVGSILVIAMFVCPPAAARLMTNRLAAQVAWSVVFAVAAALGGYVLAGYGPRWLGSAHAVSAAGMIAVCSGAILGAACVFGPARRRIGQDAESGA